MDNEYINLFFTVAEKISFMQRNGYKVERKIITGEYHTHGSSFLPLITAKIKVSKGEYSADLHKSFERELKHKLLAL